MCQEELGGPGTVARVRWRSVRAHSGSVNGQVSIYARRGSCFVAADDQTTDGVWIGSGRVATVDDADRFGLGEAVVKALGHSRTGVPHPRRDQWSVQRQRSLGPLMDAAGVRSWRSFVLSARLVTVDASRGLATVVGWNRDTSRPEVFTPDQARELRDVPTEPAALGDAVVAMLTRYA